MQRTHYNNFPIETEKRKDPIKSFDGAISRDYRSWNYFVIVVDSSLSRFRT